MSFLFVPFPGNTFFVLAPNLQGFTEQIPAKVGPFWGPPNSTRGKDVEPIGVNVQGCIT